jgi:hypothetical protein
VTQLLLRTKWRTQLPNGERPAAIRQPASGCRFLRVVMKCLNAFCENSPKVATLVFSFLRLFVLLFLNFLVLFPCSPFSIFSHFGHSSLLIHLSVYIFSFLLSSALCSYISTCLLRSFLSFFCPDILSFAF